ncbi:SAM-dependent methyltransferase [Aquimarina rhabdastrellae]
MLKDSTKWYASWFDTPYYHILYKERNYTEAQMFMDNLTQYLSLESNNHILDLACGKGRHSIYLNKIGYKVTGVDLSKNSITHASQFANDNLQFKIHDMRQPFSQQFDAVFNLFTSFGYFEHEKDNLDTIQAIKANLNETGFGVIDFLNADYVISNLVADEQKVVDNITFNIKRYAKDGYIYKDISFEDNGQSFSFSEKVEAITLQDFERYFEQAGIHLLDIFGDYHLKPFNLQTSPRLIMIFK